jgi:hypothetical protein
MRAWGYCNGYVGGISPLGKTQAKKTAILIERRLISGDSKHKIPYPLFPSLVLLVPDHHSVLMIKLNRLPGSP